MKKTKRYPVLYHKKGSKYVPCANADHWGYLMPGDYYVHVDDGGRSMTYVVQPDHEGLRAAWENKEDALMDVFKEAIKVQAPRKVTKHQKAAYDNLMDVMGKDGYCLHYNSIAEVFNAMKQEIMR